MKISRHLKKDLRKGLIRIRTKRTNIKKIKKRDVYLKNKIPKKISEKSRIWSESWFLINLFIHVLLFPLNLFLALLGKKSLNHVFKPLTLSWRFLCQAKITGFLILANIISFLAMPLLGYHIKSLVLTPNKILTAPYMVITYGFLHANVIHLIGNMIALFVFGRVVEKRLGIKMVFVYFVAMFISGIFYSIIHILINENTPMVGASGAVFGLMALAMLIDPFYITYALIIPLPVMLVAWIILLGDITGFLSNRADHIAHYAHLAGFSSVFIIYFLLSRNEKRLFKKGLLINILSLIIAIILILSISYNFLSYV